MAGQGKPMVSAQQFLTNWQNGMKSGAAAAKYKAKIQALQAAGVSPPQLAASDQAMANYQDGVNRSISSGKRAASLQNPAATQAYFTNALGQGANNLGQGASKPSAAAKVMAVGQKWGPVWQQASQAAASVTGPKGEATAMAKIQASMRVMMQAAGK